MIKDFPQYLHRPYRIFCFEMDEIAIMVAGLILSMMFVLKVMILAGAYLALYRRMKRQRPRGFFYHMGYYIGIVTFPGYPTAFIRRYTE